MVAKHQIPDDGDKFVTTYGYVRDLARRADLIREGYSQDVRRAESEADMWRNWALDLERLALRDHPAAKGRCPSCGKVTPCPTRRMVNRIRRESADEQERRDREHIERTEQIAKNRRAHLDATRPRG